MKAYLAPELELVRYQVADVLTESFDEGPLEPVPDVEDFE